VRLTHWMVLIAVLHIGFLVYEIFFWKSASGALAGYFPGGAPVDGTPGREMIRASFSNQGIYNGSLAAGLFWSAWRWNRTSVHEGRGLAAFFLGCVAIAGFYGFFTVNYAPVFLIQALPASAVLAALVYRGGPAGGAMPAA
jgi:putative membrane protein